MLGHDPGDPRFPKLKALEFEKDGILLMLLVRIGGDLLDDDVVGVNEYCFVTHD